MKSYEDLQDWAGRVVAATSELQEAKQEVANTTQAVTDAQNLLDEARGVEIDKIKALGMLKSELENS